MPAQEAIPMNQRVRLVFEDITTLQVDAIVNAANDLLGGGGLDGAIQRAAGPELLAACRLLGGCAIGEAKITKGYNLSAPYVIHTVGPIWRGGDQGEPELLASCYRNCFKLAQKYRLTSLALPTISTGACGYPKEAAADIAIKETKRALKANPKLDVVIFCCSDVGNRSFCEKAFQERM
jgi:O-acetyl-ADP-ribose deacetylase (regulator of RNase III)